MKKDDVSFSSAQENLGNNSDSPASAANQTAPAAAAPVENKPMCGCAAQVAMFKDITCIGIVTRLNIG